MAVVGAGFCGTMVTAHLLHRAQVGRVILVERAAGGVGGVAYRPGSSSHTLNVPARVADPLVAALRDRGAIRPHAQGLGLDSDAEGRVLDTTGAPSAWLSVLGPLRKGRLWENTAVPELRVEALRLAGRLGG